MDHAGAVERQTRHQAPIHQVDQDRAQPRLDHMAPQTPNDRLAGGSSLNDGMSQIPKILGAQDVGQPLQEFRNGTALDVGPRKLPDSHFARTIFERIGSNFAEIIRANEIFGHDTDSCWDRAFQMTNDE